MAKRSKRDPTERALELHRRGDLPAARKAYRAALRAAPGRADLHHFAGLAAAESGDLATGVRLLRRATELAPDVATYFGALGDALRRGGDLDAAAVSLRRAVELDPDLVPAKLDLASCLRQRGDLEEAATLAAEVVDAAPTLPEAHSALGTILTDLGRHDEAIAAQRSAVELAPRDVATRNNLGVAQRGSGDLAGAAASFERALELCPETAEATRALLLVNLGEADELRGDLAAAGDRFARATQLDPTAAAAWDRLGRVALARGDPTAARGAYRRLLELRGPSAVVLNNLGNAARAAADLDAALEHYDAALEIEPGFVPALSNAGNVLRDRGDGDAARGRYERALALDPDFADAHVNLGHLHKQMRRWNEAAASYRAALAHTPAESLTRRAALLAHLGDALIGEERLAEATDAFRASIAAAASKAAFAGWVRACTIKGDEAETAAAVAAWLAFAPQDPVAQHVAASRGGDATPSRAADAYVRETFDAFASSFDEVLTGLHYRAPQILADAVDSILGERDDLAVLDAGCGTGLCGPLLRPRAAQLVGVDLSEKMIERAGALGCYDALEAAELTSFLRARPGAFDLIVAGDVLCYFGDLGEVLTCAAAALTSGGWLAFTVEAGAGDFALQPSGRYAHGHDYVRACAAAAGLIIDRMETDVLRTERHQPVDGLVVVARAP